MHPTPSFHGLVIYMLNCLLNSRQEQDVYKRQGNDHYAEQVFKTNNITKHW